MPAIFITGINGLIGGILRSGLAGGFTISGLDRRHEPEAGGMVTADIADYPQVLEAMRASMPFDCILHLAADASLEAPWPSVLHNNIIGTHNVYEAMRVLGVRKIVLASTLHVVLPSDGGLPRDGGATPDALTALDVPPRPDSDYAVSKVFGEALAYAYYRRHGIRSVCLRFGWVTRSERPPAGREWLDAIRLGRDDLLRLVREAIASDAGFSIRSGVFPYETIARYP